jgi:hypothetical protein
MSMSSTEETEVIGEAASSLGSSELTVLTNFTSELGVVLNNGRSTGGGRGGVIVVPGGTGGVVVRGGGRGFLLRSARFVGGGGVGSVGVVGGRGILNGLGLGSFALQLFLTLPIALVDTLDGRVVAGEEARFPHLSDFVLDPRSKAVIEFAPERSISPVN